MNCPQCNLDVTLVRSSKATFCSDKCRSKYNSRLYFQQQVRELICLQCGCTWHGVSKRASRTGKLLCSSCRLSGTNSATWKGGHRYWSKGRFGRDKDGLSWKVQRRKAWERDNYTCQHCGKCPTGGMSKRKPDVHHIKPYRLSFSHALDNLLCLCQRCHKKLEVKEQEMWWGDIPFFAPPKERPQCLKCSRSIRKDRGNGLCWECSAKSCSCKVVPQKKEPKVRKLKVSNLDRVCSKCGNPCWAKSENCVCQKCFSVRLFGSEQTTIEMASKAHRMKSENLSLRAIGVILGCSHTTVRKLLIKHDSIVSGLVERHPRKKSVQP